VKPALVLILTGVAVAAIAMAEDELPPALADLFSQGVEAQKKGKLDTAEKVFLEVLRQGGRKAFVYNNLGIVYQHRADHKRAIEQFREAGRLDATYAAPRVLLGSSLLALGRVREATAELENAVKINPREPAARLELARAYERSGNFTGMVEQLRQLRESAPRDPEYAYQLGRAYMKLSGWCFQEILRVAPGSARVHQTLGETMMARGREAEAVQAYEKAAAADPQLAGIHLALAGIYLRQNKPEEARQEIELELAIAPESAMALAIKRKLENVRR
jgi:tetratricopeptide (TPR) repeat protein